MASRPAQPESVGTRALTFARIEGPTSDGTASGPAPHHPWWLGAMAPPGAVAKAPGTAQIGAWMALYGNWMSFCQLRLRKDFETLAGMTLCRTPQEASAVWVRAVCDAASDYADLAGRIIDPKH